MSVEKLVQIWKSVLICRYWILDMGSCFMDNRRQ